ncbi:MAG: hypothetical protein IJM59_02420 [Proteobacteria bacterium]|nr:hypothetical protein [Pseudomonadota bacterium]
MKKVLLFLTAMSMAMLGCSIDDVLNLGPACPNMSYIQINEIQCDAESTESVCKTFNEAGAYDNNRCPLGYRCMQMEVQGGSNYCYCPNPCNDTCCTDGQICNAAGQCVLPPDTDCTKDSECKAADMSRPYCDPTLHKCVECIDNNKTHKCKGERICKNNKCYECLEDDDCSKGMVCDAHRCVQCHSSEPASCDGNAVIYCASGFIMRVKCPPTASMCKNGECVECVSNKNKPDSCMSCINNKCIDCYKDSDCTSDPSRPYCNNNRCVSCLNHSDCENLNDENNSNLNYCSPNGQCVECINDEYESTCEGKEWYHCDNETIKIDHCDATCSDKDGCVACTNDKDCKQQQTGSMCVDNKCIECMEDADCDENKTKTKCNNIGICSECMTNEDCKGSDAKYCNENDGACVECLTSVNCTEKNRPICGADHYCIEECVTNADCGDNLRCKDGNCIKPPEPGKCFDDTDCPDGVCNLINETCVDCTKEKSSCPDNKYCDVNNMKCVECIENDHCPSKYCENNTCLDCKNGSQKCEAGTQSVCIGNKWEPKPCADASNNPLNCYNDMECEVCPNGQQRCQNNTVETCNGKTWTTVKICEKGCNGNACADCSDGDSKCDNSGQSTCSSGVWGSPVSCNGNGCFGDKCANCPPGEVKCESGSRKTCQDNNWKSDPCPTGTCINSKECETKECESGLRCSGNTVQECRNYKWATSQICNNDQTCSQNQCVSTKPTYRYAKIEYAPCGSSNCSSSDNGPDIDAVLLNGSYPATASGNCNPSFGSCDKATGFPDSINGTTCYYRQNGSYTFATISSGYQLILDFGRSFTQGDYLTVYELSGCWMPDTNPPQTARDDGMNVSVSSDGANWKSIFSTSSVFSYAGTITIPIP